MKFKYLSDEKYFAELLTKGNVEKLKNKFKDYFDFRPPRLKRKEFNVDYKNLFKNVFKKAGGICQICKFVKGTQIDHIIPLSSNVLNKELRLMSTKIVSGKFKKVPSESYGSNNLKNLQLVCKKCNRKKWNKLK